MRHSIRRGFLFVVAALAGCAAVPPVVPATAATAVVSAFPGVLPASFSGTLPCADCPGIRFAVELYPDGAVVHRTSYQGKGEGGGDLHYDAVGRWEMTQNGQRLVLNVGREAPTLFAVRGLDSLELLGVPGQQVDSPFNRTLTRDASFVPIEPQLFMLGMYSYMADAGVFTECSTGWKLPVAMEADNAALERGYAYAGGTAGEPILVNLEGRIAQRPSMESALPPQRSLVPIRFNRAWPGETCTKRIAMTSTPDSSPSPLALERTRWGLLDSQLAAPAPGAGRDRVSIEFAADRLSANSGCNTGAAGYRIEADGTLVLTTAMATTMMACLGDAAAYERAFFGFLGSRPRVSREAGGEVLVLRGPAAADPPGTHVLRLRSVPMASATARQKFIYVASERAPCVGVAPMQCLQVRESKDQPWRMFYGEIVGFEFQPGTEYRLRVLEDDVPNPPADGSSKRWFLDLVVERRVVQAEK